MDFEYAVWQMIYLFISPQKVYRNFHYRKSMSLFVNKSSQGRKINLRLFKTGSKAQFARDDPAFLVLLGVWLCGRCRLKYRSLASSHMNLNTFLVSSMVFSFYLDLSIINSIKFLLYTIFIDCLLLGAIVATAMWYVQKKIILITVC